MSCRLHRRYFESIWGEGTTLCLPMITIPTNIFPRIQTSLNYTTSVARRKKIISSPGTTAELGPMPGRPGSRLTTISKSLGIKLIWQLPGTLERRSHTLIHFELGYRNFEKTILGAYRWLSDNYKKEDRIFLFGT